MRNPKKGKAKPGKAKAKPSKKKEEEMELDEEPETATAKVWRPGIDEVAEDEELEYDPTAYDCLHRFQVDWPCLSFDILKDDLGGPRSTFPHTVYLACGTQAATARQNYVAFLRLASLGQGRHGKKAAPQPGVVAVWGDNAQVKLIDGSKLLAELAAETEPTAANAKGKGGTNKAKPQDLKPLASHTHSSEGYALDWSAVRPGRLASGDCRHKIHVWEPAEGGRWAVGGAHTGHEGSVEDIQWSPTEDTVFASCGVDRSVRIWDTRERGRPMLTAAGAHDSDVNVISWNRGVTYMLAHVTSVEWCPYEGSMLASAAADNQLAVWDLALERDPEEEAALAPEGNAAAPEDLPAQLLFLHAGQNDLKELHWHSQIPGLIVSTAGDGFNLFKVAVVMDVSPVESSQWCFKCWSSPPIDVPSGPVHAPRAGPYWALLGLIAVFLQQALLDAGGYQQRLAATTPRRPDFEQLQQGRNQDGLVTNARIVQASITAPHATQPPAQAPAAHQPQRELQAFKRTPPAQNWSSLRT
eukprot:XP_001697148.1 predicted protein [Chlamydomonas reinhardtii]